LGYNKEPDFPSIVFGMPDLCLVFGLDEILRSLPNLEKETHVKLWNNIGERDICHILSSGQAGCVNLMRHCPAPNLGYSTVGRSHRELDSYYRDHEMDHLLDTYDRNVIIPLATVAWKMFRHARYLSVKVIFLPNVTVYSLLWMRSRYLSRTRTDMHSLDTGNISWELTLIPVTSRFPNCDPTHL